MPEGAAQWRSDHTPPTLGARRDHRRIRRAGHQLCRRDGPHHPRVPSGRSGRAGHQDHAGRGRREGDLGPGPERQAGPRGGHPRHPVRRLRRSRPARPTRLVAARRGVGRPHVHRSGGRAGAARSGPGRRAAGDRRPADLDHGPLGPDRRPQPGPAPSRARVARATRVPDGRGRDLGRVPWGSPSPAASSGPVDATSRPAADCSGSPASHAGRRPRRRPSTSPGSRPG